jgi:hypothetical protein
MSFVLTVSQVIDSLKTAILAKRANTATQPGSVVNDLFLQPEGALISRERINLEWVSRTQDFSDTLGIKTDTVFQQQYAAANGITLADVFTKVSAAIDRLASNVKKTRLPATPSSGTVLYGRPQAPTVDITIPINATVQATNNQQYKTTASVTMFAAQAVTYYNATLRLYVISVPVQSINSGSLTQALAGTTNKLITSVAGLTTVLNTTPISGGTDQETDEALAARAQLVYTGNNVGTPDGVKQLLLDNFAVGDVLVLPAGNPLLTRNGGIGVMDVYVRNRNIQAATEVFGNYNDPLFPTTGIRPTKQPATSLVSASTGLGVFVEDGVSTLSGSVKSQARFDFSGGAPSFPVTISYTYNAIVEQCQQLLMQSGIALLGDQTYAVLLAGSDILAQTEKVLVKEALPVYVDMTAQIVVQAGLSKAAVIAQVQANLASQINSLPLGQTLYQSDVVAVIQDTTGVLGVNEPLTQFNVTGTPGTVTSVPIAPNQFAQLLNVVIL